MPDYLPIMLRVRGRRCVVVGGGGVARRRAEALLACGAEVTVISPAVDAGLAELPVAVERRAYAAGDLAGAVLVVVATDERGVNEQVAREAAERGVLVNRADEPGAGDVVVPAHAHHGPVTLSVYTGGRSASAAAAIRRELDEALDPDWPRLLEAVGPYRERLQVSVADPADRRDRLRRLTDGRAMAILKAQGVDALHAHLRAIAGEAEAEEPRGRGSE